MYSPWGCHKENGEEVMSKKSYAKLQQCYETKPKRRMCSNCVSYESTFDYPAWLKEEGLTDVEMEDAGYSKQEYRLRCGLGNFAVKKTAVCRKHDFREES